MEHLLTNSQAALFFSNGDNAFVQSVNFLQELPYLSFLEVTLLGVPLFIHGLWGIAVIRSASYNSLKTDGSAPSLGIYRRNRAYTWQRWTGLFLLLAIGAHVIEMRFIERPLPIEWKGRDYYLIKVEADKRLEPLAHQLGVEIYYNNLKNLKEEWLLEPGEAFALSPSFGTAELLVVREAFKGIGETILYTLLVLAACYHGFNGLWTCMITWGIATTEKGRRIMQSIAVGLMLLVALLGLTTIWGVHLYTYGT